MEKFSNDFGTVTMRFGGKQRLFTVEEAIFFVSYLSQDTIDLQNEGRLKVLIGHSGAVARVERPSDARLDTTQKDARFRFAQKNERRIAHVAVDYKRHLAEDRFFIEATNGWLTFSELFDEFGARKASCLWIKVIEVCLVGNLTRPVGSSLPIDGVEIELGHLYEGFILT